MSVVLGFSGKGGPGVSLGIWSMLPCWPPPNQSWLAHRTGLRARTLELYESQLRNYLVPAFGSRELSEITPIEVRLWFSELTKRRKPSPATCSKLYRLLRTILNTAVEDELIPKNACNIKGAGNELSAERPVATIEQVDASAEGVEERYRVLVYLATYTTLRFGELFGLRRKDVDLGSGRVEVTQQEGHLAGGLLVFGPPKSAAGRRTVAIPNFLLPDVAAHLERFVGPGPDQFVSEDRAASFRADRTGARCGGGWRSRPASRVCASTTCGTPAIRSLLQREHRRRS